MKNDPSPLVHTSVSSFCIHPSYFPRTLRSELTRQSRLPPVDAAQLVLRLATALGHLHAHGLVHRVLQFRADGGECVVLTRAGEPLQLHAFERPSHREFAEDLGPRSRHAAFSSDGRWLAASAGNRLGVWDLAGNGPGALAEEGAEARPSFTADGQELFGSRNDNDCFRWRIAPGTNLLATPVLQRIDVHKPAGFTSLSLASNLIVFTGSRGSRIVELENIAANEGGWASTSRGINGASPDGQWLAIFRPFTPFLYVYRLPGLERVAKLTNQANVARFKFSPLGDEVAVATRDAVEFWSTNTWERTRVMTNFIDILLAPDGAACWLTKDFHTAGLYDTRTLEALLPLPTGMLPLALSPDGRYLAVSVDMRRLQMWDLAEVRERFRELSVDWARQAQSVPPHQEGD